MIGKRWATAVVAAFSALGAGCVCCDHRVCQAAIEAGPRCGVPTAERQKVYVFLVNGITPGLPDGLDALREKLAAEGFPKVASGSVLHACWMLDEMKRIVKCDRCDARFVLVGFDLGGGAAAKLAADAMAAGLPVDAVVLLDPMGKTATLPAGVRTLLVTSGSGPSSVPHAEVARIPDVGHFRLPTHPQTVAVICHLLNDIAAKQWQPESDLIPEWTYEHAPPIRLPVFGGQDVNLLCDTPGGRTTPIGPLQPAPPPYPVSLSPRNTTP